LKYFLVNKGYFAFALYFLYHFELFDLIVNELIASVHAGLSFLFGVDNWLNLHMIIKYNNNNYN
jgi:hypothetical protein